MPHFRPFLSLGLSNYEEHQVCAVAIGVVGDICRALEAKVLPYCDEIVHLLLRNLQNPALNRNVKPPILSCFGDIALAVGGQFEKYMQVTMSMLVQASGTAIDPNNPDLVDYLNQVRRRAGPAARRAPPAAPPCVLSERGCPHVPAAARGHLRGVHGRAAGLARRREVGSF